MLKIHKCLRLTRDLSHRVKTRNKSLDCDPKYECKISQETESEKFLEKQRKAMTPKLFREHCHRDPKIYKNAFFFICLPIIICYYINLTYFYNEKRKRMKFLEFSHLRIRRKPYPWDPERTLFHNPRYNALPKGYEFEVPEDEEYDPFDRDSPK